MPRTASILSLLLLAGAGLWAQDRTAQDDKDQAQDQAPRAALKGCLSATAAGNYRLAEDESGAVYNLIGNPETLRMLVGTDVLVTGQNLETRQPPHQNESNSGGSTGQIQAEPASYPADGQAVGANSFRVINAVKVADVCVLSAAQSASLLPQ